jgi:DNA-binding NarL/FixJ family response regulator
MFRIDELQAQLDASRGKRSYPFGLTEREVEVLQRVTHGLTDPEVAEELFISPRTVGQHLRSIYNKLNVNNRTEATRVAVQREIV